MPHVPGGVSYRLFIRNQPLVDGGRSRLARIPQPALTAWQTVPVEFGGHSKRHRRYGRVSMMVKYTDRLMVKKEWIGRGVVLCFPLRDAMYQVPHDTLIAILETIDAPYFDTYAWRVDGVYSTGSPGEYVVNALLDYEARPYK